jgi:hypothetical protein
MASVGESAPLEFEEEAVKLMPGDRLLWLEISQMYEQSGRLQEAQQARERASTLGGAVQPAP